MAKIQVYKFINPGVSSIKTPSIVAARQTILAQNRFGKTLEGVGNTVLDLDKITNLRVNLEQKTLNEERKQEFGRHIVDCIAEFSPNFKDLINHYEVRTPLELDNEVGLTEGNIFQGELTMDQLMFNRPVPGYAQYRTPLKYMYMCSSSTHPGGGVMGAPGANAAREVLIDMNIPQTGNYY